MREKEVQIDMLTGGAPVLGLLTTRLGIAGMDRETGTWLNALEARMRVHAVNMTKNN